jgi:hypothetical protein
MPSRLRGFINLHLAADEVRQITEQFAGSCIPNRQVLWTGMTREFAQNWADEHDMQTLTTAMGPLMENDSPARSATKKSRTTWTKYIHGASALFAWHVSKGECVTVLSQPPPERFHPSGATSFQIIEEPIIKGRLGNRPVQRIDVVHPTVLGAFKASYQLWPHDHAFIWVSVFGDKKVGHWRQVKPRRAVTGVEDAVCSGDGSMDTSTATAQARKVQEEEVRGRRAPLTSIEERLRDLKRKQSREMKMLLKERAGTQRQLQDRHAKETQSFEKKQTQKRKALQVKGERRMLHEKGMREMGLLQARHRQDMTGFREEDRRIVKRLKERQKREREGLRQWTTRGGEGKSSASNPQYSLGVGEQETQPSTLQPDPRQKEGLDEERSQGVGSEILSWPHNGTWISGSRLLLILSGGGSILMKAIESGFRFTY